MALLPPSPPTPPRPSPPHPSHPLAGQKCDKKMFVMGCKTCKPNFYQIYTAPWGKGRKCAPCPAGSSSSAGEQLVLHPCTPTQACGSSPMLSGWVKLLPCSCLRPASASLAPPPPAPSPLLPFTPLGALAEGGPSDVACGCPSSHTFVFACAAGSGAFTDCVCDGNTWLDTTSKTCKPCIDGQVFNGVCVPCKDGTLNAHGVCECKEGSLLSSTGVCVPCKGGSLNAQGACECPANDYLEHGVCTHCPANTQSLPGRLMMSTLHATRDDDSGLIALTCRQLAAVVCACMSDARVCAHTLPCAVAADCRRHSHSPCHVDWDCRL